MKLDYRETVGAMWKVKCMKKAGSERRLRTYGIMGQRVVMVGRELRRRK